MTLLSCFGSQTHHFAKTTTEVRINRRGKPEHCIFYDDGIREWHDLASESWVLLTKDGQADTDVVPIDTVMQQFVEQRRNVRQRQRLIRDQHSAMRSLKVIHLLQSCEDAPDLLTVCDCTRPTGANQIHLCVSNVRAITGAPCTPQCYLWCCLQLLSKARAGLPNRQRANPRAC